MSDSLTLLYTHQLRGDLTLLPRLYTHIRRLHESIDGRILLLDLGDSCAPEVWHCAVTGGRSTLIGLDALGYHAANINGVLNPINRAKLAEQVALTLHDGGEYHDAAAGVTLRLTPQAQTQWVDGVLHLAAVAQGAIGQVKIVSPDVLDVQVHPLPADALPDPTIAGVVDFILSEARYAQKKRDGEV